ncbi:glycosyltransferase family 87 protein [Bradyrhizobium sp. UFLA05-112]
MAELALSPPSGLRPGSVPSVLFNVCLVLLVLTLLHFPLAYISHSWIYDANGLGNPTDFVNVWAAGRLALDGNAIQAWDWQVQKQVEVAVLGQDFSGYFAWHYPPPFLFVAAFLAQFPYAVAFAGWAFASMLPYVALMRAIVGRSFGVMLAIAFPATFDNLAIGQNGFLTASLIGGTLYLLPRHQVLAGICLGLLTYKPQYGLLFPLVLVASGEWKVFVSAAITAVCVVLTSMLVFGVESWVAFLHWMPMISKAVLSEGAESWLRLQSVFAMVRCLGGSETLGWALQAVVASAVAIGLVLMWRSKVPYALKAAALATGTLLCSPYTYMYDFAVLAIPVAWLVRAGYDDGFRAYEPCALGFMLALLASFPFLKIPVGLAATLIVAALIVARAVADWRELPASPAGLASSTAAS